MEKTEFLRPQFKTSLQKAFKNVDISSEAHVNTALSVSMEGLPARFLAGITPAFSLAEAISEQFGVATHVRIFAPINIAVACNGFDLMEASKVVEQGQKIVGQFQQAIFPSVPWRLTIDQPWNSTGEQLLQSIWDRSFELDEEQLNQARDAVVQTGKQNTHLYIPHHLFGWQDCFDQSIFPEDDKPKSGELVINCMSQSERNFQSFRKRLAWDLQVSKPELVSMRSPIDVITERCPGPHYIRSRDETRIEPSLDDLLSDGFVKTVRAICLLARENSKFETARNDLLNVFDFFHQRWIENPNNPTLDEFLGGLV